MSARSDARSRLPRIAPACLAPAVTARSRLPPLVLLVTHRCRCIPHYCDAAFSLPSLDVLPSDIRMHIHPTLAGSPECLICLDGRPPDRPQSLSIRTMRNPADDRLLDLAKFSPHSHHCLRLARTPSDSARAVAGSLLATRCCRRTSETV